MATDNMMGGLFTTPEQYQMAQRQAALGQIAQEAQMDPYERVNYLAGASGYGLGKLAGGIMGSQDPQLQRQTQRRAFIQQIDMTDPNSLVQGIRASSSDPELNAFLLGKYKELETINKTKAETVAKMREGNAAMLTTEQRNFIQARDDGYKGSFNQWLTEQKKAGSTNVNVSTGENAYGTAFGKGIADQDLAKYNLAQKAPEILATADNTEKLLQGDKVFTGTGASAKLNLLALGQGLGVTGKNADEIIANTQQLQQQRSQAVLNQIKSSGLGTGQGFTDKDLKFLQDSAAGSITLSKETLQRQINVERKVARAATKDWNSRLGSMPQKVVGPMGLSTVELPTQTAFDSVEEATAAKLPKNTIITIGGRKAVVE